VAKEYPFYCAGEWRTSNDIIEIKNPYDSSIVGKTSFASDDDLEFAITQAEAAFREHGQMPSYERAGYLTKIADQLHKRRDEIAMLITQEAAKPLRDSTVEVDRGVFTLRLAAEEAQRITGEQIPLDLMPASKGRFGITRKVPIGPIAGISPFNFPLNLALHKLGPALASGNPLVLKPPTRDPLTMLTVAEMVHEAGVPAGLVSIMPMDRHVGDRLVTDERFKLLSFTGSPDVGWDMKSRAGKKKVVLELGGNAGVIVDRDANLDFAVSRIITGAFAYAGQVCISVQRVYIHAEIFDEVVEKLKQAAANVKHGDPASDATDLGPMIDEKAVSRIHEWVTAARDEGATIHAGGEPDGRFYPPTILSGVSREAFVCTREAFAPIVVLFPFDEWSQGLDEINDSVFGLQAGVFTDSLEHGFQAFDKLDVGGVILNDIPTYRIDHMPYGGVKDSGLSREGLRYAIDDMTETRLLVVHRP
jgi:acyl-CoA reductase-like NAD-dependent aldehyde dehydrogenase